MGIDNDPFPEVDELEANSALSSFAKELVKELSFGEANICTGFLDFGNDSYASLRAKVGSINAKASVQIKVESSAGSTKPSPMLEAGFMHHLCLRCRAIICNSRIWLVKEWKPFKWLHLNSSGPQNKNMEK